MKYALAIILSVLAIIYSPVSHAAVDTAAAETHPEKLRPGYELCANQDDAGQWKCLKKLSEVHEENNVLFAMLQQCLNSPSAEYRMVCTERAFQANPTQN